MNRLVPVAALALLVGCNGDGFSKKEAEIVAESNAKASSGAYGSLNGDMTARSTISEVEWTQTDDGFTFAGIVTSDGPEWTGALTVDGQLVQTDTSATWSMDVAYDEVTVDGTTLDGAISWDWALAYSDVGFAMTSHTEGEITATGEAEGTGQIDTTSELVLDTTGMSATVTGTVDGHEVDFDYTGAWDLSF